jgi:ribosomal protein S12
LHKILRRRRTTRRPRCTVDKHRVTDAAWPRNVPSQRSVRAALLRSATIANAQPASALRCVRVQHVSAALGTVIVRVTRHLFYLFFFLIVSGIFFIRTPKKNKML